MISTRQKNRGGVGLSQMTRSINFLPTELWHAFGVCQTRACRVGGVKSLPLAVTDGFSSLFPLSFPWRLGHISSVINNRVLCLYELIKDGRKQRDDTSNSCVHLS